MDLRDQLNNDLKDAMKSKDKLRTETLRGLRSAVRYAEIEAGPEFGDEDLTRLLPSRPNNGETALLNFKRPNAQIWSKKKWLNWRYWSNICRTNCRSRK